MVYLAERLSYDEQAVAHDWLDSFERHRAARRHRYPAVWFLSLLLRPFKADRRHRMVRQVTRVCPSGQLLDVGCGEGQLLEATNGRFNVTGVDISETLVAMAMRQVPEARFIVGPLTEVVLPEDYFDVATMISYLEHEWQPREALEIVRKTLKPGGWLVLKVPNHASWMRTIYGKAWCGYRFPDHCNYFTRPLLERILRETGFYPQSPALGDRLPTNDNIWCFAQKKLISST